ncbi:MAG: hypothetical protein JEZ12_03775 [Desulfobacterium sp.]|nr:hypothetical protein [Desulfobacterium sp.]
MISLKLPELEFDIPDMDFTPFRKETDIQKKRLEQIVKKTGKSSMAFKTSQNRLISCVKKGEKGLERHISSSLDIRALTDLWLNNKFNENCPVSAPLIEKIFSVRSYPGSIAFIQLLRLFFKRFDKCGDFKALIDGIHKGFRQLEGKRLTTDIQAIAKYRNPLLSGAGPDWLVRQAIERKIDFDALQQEMGITYFSGGRFGDICKTHYYLHQLRDLQPNGSSSILSEIMKSDVYDAPYKDKLLLGHEILSVLIDKAPVSELNREWQDVILGIAGDPRVPKGSVNYQKWWQILGDERIAKVHGWLSKFDLLLFLEVLHEYGKNSGKIDLERMFPARKKFLEGLHKQKLIHGSRLFVSTAADRYLKRHYKSSELPQYAVCNSDISVIYLNVQGRHMIEGSHSFSLWIYDDLPGNTNVLDYGQHRFSSRELGVGLSEEYQEEKQRAAEKYELNKFSWKPDVNKAEYIFSKVKFLGSYKNVKKMYGSESNIDRYARKVALDLFGSNAKRSAGQGRSLKALPEQNYSDFPINIRHVVGLNWQHRAIEAFGGLNIKINPEYVFAKKDYEDYKNKYGLKY